MIFQTSNLFENLKIQKNEFKNQKSKSINQPNTNQKLIHFVKFCSNLKFQFFYFKLFFLLLSRLTFAAPHSSFFKEQVVESVLVPGVSGDFCILVGHVPTIAQLRPGTVTVTPKVCLFYFSFFISFSFHLHLFISILFSFPLSPFDFFSKQKIIFQIFYFKITTGRNSNFLLCQWRIRIRKRRFDL